MDMSVKPETAESAVKRSLNTIKGAVVPQQIRLNHPGLRKTFKHTYDITDAHLYYSVVFCRATLPEELITPDIHNLRDLLTNALGELDKLSSQMGALAEQNGVTIGHSFNDQVFDTQASTPMSKLFLDVFRKADAYLVIIDSLWIEGVLGDDQHGKAGPAMCQICHSVSKRINDVFRKLLGESNKRKPGNAAPMPMPILAIAA